MHKIAIIPARGGSKRIPRKNIRSFCGKPMIAYSIDAAQKASVFDEIIVSTDDEEIAAIAQALGASVPFLRPSELADDYTGTLPVIAHTVRAYESQVHTIDFACCIYATAPFLKPEFLRKGLQVLTQQLEAEFAFSVTSYAFPVFRALRIAGTGFVEMFWPENEAKRSQDLPQAWHDAGQFYWGRREAFLTRDGVFNARALPVSLPRHLVQDIDTIEDWDRAERMFRAWGHPDAPQP
jgi:pseudaminic acid cytidylyltransferase